MTNKRMLNERMMNERRLNEKRMSESGVVRFVNGVVVSLTNDEAQENAEHGCCFDSEDEEEDEEEEDREYPPEDREYPPVMQHTLNEEEKTERVFVVVRRKTIEGVDYFIDIKKNILYNADNREEVGIWDEASGTIQPLPDEEEEEEEEEEDEVCDELTEEKMVIRILYTKHNGFSLFEYINNGKDEILFDSGLIIYLSREGLMSLAKLVSREFCLLFVSFVREADRLAVEEYYSSIN